MPDGTKDPASLENLHDIIVPGPVPWWPPAPGWYVLGILVLVAAILLLIKALMNWRNNRYRREALAELAQIQQASRETDGRPAAIARLDELLKRVALAAWPRETVAPLSGQRWLDLLSQTGRARAFTTERTQVLCDVAYCRKQCAQLSPGQVEELFTAAGDWIISHDPSASGTHQPQESDR